MKLKEVGKLANKIRDSPKIYLVHPKILKEEGKNINEPINNYIEFTVSTLPSAEYFSRDNHFVAHIYYRKDV